MGASTLDQPQTEPKRSSRKDPAPRRLDAMANAFNLRKQDPTKVYKWVNTLDQFQGPEFYRDIGYEAVGYQPGGPQVVGGSYARTVGEPIVRQGQMLMCTSVENAARIDEEGIDGSGGRLGADRLDAMIQSKEYAEEAISMLGPRYARVRNETTRSGE